jgi:xylulokinase
LVVIDKDRNPLRPSIIWCDSRAVNIGEKAMQDMGANYCLEHFLNSPGNFTASKLKWVQEKEPTIFSRIHKIMLPGDYIAMKLTGEIVTLTLGFQKEYSGITLRRPFLTNY